MLRLCYEADAASGRLLLARMRTDRESKLKSSLVFCFPLCSLLKSKQKLTCYLILPPFAVQKYVMGGAGEEPSRSSPGTSSRSAARVLVSPWGRK